MTRAVRSFPAAAAEGSARLESQLAELEAQRAQMGEELYQQMVQAITLGCEVSHAREMVYSDGVDLDSLESAVPIGSTCRLCERMDCQQRAFPPLQSPMRVDETVRGISFYATPLAKER